MPNVTIHYARPGKPEALYHEGLVRDDGVRLDTCSMVPTEYTATLWQKDGFLKGHEVHQVRKHHFYQEWFDIIELFDQHGQRLGCYCDIATPLEKRGGDYYLQDLCLDLWIAPDGACIELDWDEFEAAIGQGLISPPQQAAAVQTLRRLVDEVNQGRFPAPYLPADDQP